MLNELSWALAAAALLTLAGVVLKRPRKTLTTWAAALVSSIYRRVRQTDQLERLELAVERLAAMETQRRCAEDGNPDEEFRSDWQRYYTGDLEANVDYRRKQERDVERMRRGDFNPQLPYGSGRSGG
jgi:DNA-nicking Smr family endonuclease